MTQYHMLKLHQVGFGRMFGSGGGWIRCGLFEGNVLAFSGGTEENHKNHGWGLDRIHSESKVICHKGKCPLAATFLYASTFSYHQLLKIN